MMKIGAAAVVIALAFIPPLVFLPGTLSSLIVMAGLQAWMLLFVAIFAFVQPAYAFGAGVRLNSLRSKYTTVSENRVFVSQNIPSFAYLEGKAFRHGGELYLLYRKGRVADMSAWASVDIEDTLAALLKVAGGGMLGIGGKKFGGLDIKVGICLLFCCLVSSRTDVISRCLSSGFIL